ILCVEDAQDNGSRRRTQGGGSDGARECSPAAEPTPPRSRMPRSVGVSLALVEEDVEAGVVRGGDVQLPSLSRSASATPFGPLPVLKSRLAANLPPRFKRTLTEALLLFAVTRSGRPSPS